MTLAEWKRLARRATMTAGLARYYTEQAVTAPPGAPVHGFAVQVQRRAAALYARVRDERLGVMS